MEFKHYSVLLNETIEQLHIRPDGIYVDGTLGGGGHSLEICRHLTTGRLIGIQMASAYVGNLTMPPLFGLLANNITPALFPFYLLALLVLMVCMHEQLVRKTRRS